MSLQVVGTRPVRPDGVEKVTGRAVYGADVYPAGLIHGKVVRSPYAHARIKSIDASQALAMPGVLAVVTAHDLPTLAGGDEELEVGESTTQKRWMRDLVIAREKVLHHGHAVAAVAATDPHLAEKAAKAIQVEYDVLRPVLDPVEAMSEDAPVLHDDLFTVRLGKQTRENSNIASYRQYAYGDVESGFAEADVVVEREFRTQTVHQGYVEPQTATAMAESDGTVTVWTPNQGAHGVRGQLAELLGLPMNKIKVIPTEIGGGFGGKIQVYLEPLAILLSRKAGRPVKMVMSRSEVFQATGPTCAAHIKVRVGARRDGTLTAMQAKIVLGAGCFPTSPIAGAMGVIFAPYLCANKLIDGYDVVVNKPGVKPYRAPGGPIAAYAGETVIDEVAELLGIDPLVFRQKNAVRTGDQAPYGPKFPEICMVDVIKAGMESEHYNAPIPQGPNQGRGVAMGFWFNFGGSSSAHLAVNHDGTVNLSEGSTDIGGSRASMAMMVAEEMGIPYDHVKVQVADTDSVGFSDVTNGSRVTYATGLACIEAARDVIRQLRQRAAMTWRTSVEDISYELGKGCVRISNPDQVLTIAQIATDIRATGGPICAVGSVFVPERPSAFAMHIADVEVDPETGKVTILRYTSIQDVGRAIHPSYVEGQLQGGAAQGISWALHEEYVYDGDGILRNANLLDYRMPTALDLPMIDTVLVEVPHPSHPYGVRGVGEVAIVPPIAAVANAIYRATGVRFCQLPITPERICTALMK